MSHLTTIAFLSLLGMSVNAQVPDTLSSIEGVIYSSINSQPVGESLVNLKGTKYGALTDSSGYFRIDEIPPRDYQLEVIGFGYSQIDTAISLEPGSLHKLNFTLVGSCPFDAQKDIERSKPKLLLVGSIAPVIYPDQEKFERKFDVEYYDFGDTPPADACIEKYNKTVFKFLDHKFGKEWRQGGS